MPPSIRLALGAAFLVAAVGALSTALWLADTWGGGAGTRWLSTLPAAAAALDRAGSPLLLLAVVAIPVVLQRDAGKARIVSQLGLLGAITLAVMALGFGSTGPVRLDAGLAGMLAVSGLLATLALALQRPAAREWLASE